MTEIGAPKALTTSGGGPCADGCCASPAGPGQRQALFLGQPNQLGPSLLLGLLLGPLLLRYSIQCRHHGTFPAEHHSACQAGKTVNSTVPGRVADLVRVACNDGR